MSKIIKLESFNQYKGNYDAVQDSATFDALNDKFSVKPYFIEYRPLKTVLVGVSYLVQLVTVAVSFIALYAILAPLTNVAAAGIISGLLLIAIEAVKRLTFSPTVKNYLQFKKVALFSLVLSVSMLCVSLWLTWNGSHETVYQLTAPPTLLSIQDATATDQAKVKGLTRQLSDIKKSQSWKGKLTATGQRSFNAIAKQLETIGTRISAKETAIQAKNDAATMTHDKKTAGNAGALRYITLILDILLFVLLAWLEYYDYRSFAEYAQHDAPVRIDAMRRDAKSIENAPDQEPPRAIVTGFHRSQDQQHTAPDICQYCAAGYTRKTTFQKYCSEQCRVQSWQERTGKELKRVGKNK